MEKVRYENEILLDHTLFRKKVMIKKKECRLLLRTSQLAKMIAKNILEVGL